MEPVFVVRKTVMNPERFYFVLVGSTGTVIARSEHYKTLEGCINGISLVMDEAPIADAQIEEQDGTITRIDFN